MLIRHSSDLAAAVERDVAAMGEANYTCTPGDVACLQAGHIAGQTVRDLINGWDTSLSVADRISIVIAHMTKLASSSFRNEAG